MGLLHALLVDDHPIFRKGLISLLQQDSRIGKVTEACDGSEALALLRHQAPDISFLDLYMPGRDGLDILTEFTRLQPRMKVVIITAADGSDSLTRAFALGAVGFLLKADASDKLYHCLDAVLDHSTYVSPGIRLTSAPGIPEEEKKLSLLTPSECRVLALVGEFLTSRQIADRLYISPRTVQNHRANICRKLDIQGVHQLTQFAVRHAQWLKDAAKK